MFYKKSRSLGAGLALIVALGGTGSAMVAVPSIAFAADTVNSAAAPEAAAPEVEALHSDAAATGTAESNLADEATAPEAGAPGAEGDSAPEASAPEAETAAPETGADSAAGEGAEDAAAPEAEGNKPADDNTETADEALNLKNLKDGTYTITIDLQQASNITKPSMAHAVFTSPATVEVKGGKATLKIQTGEVKVMTIVGRLSSLSLYPNAEVKDNALVPNGDPQLLWEAQDKENGEKPLLEIPLNDKQRETGYVGVQLTTPAMAGMTPDAVIVLDKASLKANEQPGTPDKPDTPDTPDTPDQPDKPDTPDTPDKPDTPDTPDTPSTPTAPDTPSTPNQPSAPAKVTYEAGHTYAVPMQILKPNGSKSMADQYFGDTANARVNSDGTYTLTFTTNRSDYITALIYNGQALKVTPLSGTNATFEVTIPATKANTYLPIGFDIKPMRALGGDVQTAHVWFYFADAKVKDLGTGNVNPPSSGKTGNAPSGAAGGSLSKTGSTSAGIVAGLAAVSLAFIAGGVALRTRKFYA